MHRANQTERRGRASRSFLGIPTRILLASCLAALSILGTRPAVAESPACPESNAAAAIACELGRSLALPRTDPLVVVAGLPASDRPLRDGSGLSGLIARLVAGSIGQDARVGATTSLAVARGIAKPEGKLLYLELAVRDGILAVTADVHDVRLGFWDRIRNPPRAPVAHAFASRRIDAEITSFLERPPLVTLSERAFSGPRGVLAAACGDTDGDETLELVVVTRRGVQIGRFRDDRFESERAVRWSALSPVAGVPLRQPIATARVSDEGVWVGISDRRDALLLTPELEVQRRLEGLPLDRATCLRVTGTALGRIVPCRAGDEAVSLGESLLVDAFASATLPDERGQRHRWRALRAADTNSVVLGVDGRETSETLPDTGAQIALGDLDLDGRPEVLTSLPVDERKADALVIRTIGSDGSVASSLRHPMPLGIDAIATCPPERAGLNQTVVASDGKLLVLQ